MCFECKACSLWQRTIFFSLSLFFTVVFPHCMHIFVCFLRTTITLPLYFAPLSLHQSLIYWAQYKIFVLLPHHNPYFWCSYHFQIQQKKNYAFFVVIVIKVLVIIVITAIICEKYLLKSSKKKPSPDPK